MFYTTLSKKNYLKSPSAKCHKNHIGKKKRQLHRHKKGGK